MSLLDAIAAERTGLLAPIAEKLAALYEIERLALEAGYEPDDVVDAGVVEPEPEVVPPATPRALSTPRRAKVQERRAPRMPHRDETAARYATVIAAVRACQPVSPVEIRERTGLSSDQTAYMLRVGIDRGMIVKEGKGREARYSITADRDRLEAERNGRGTGIHQGIRWSVLAAIRDRRATTEDDLAALLVLSAATVADATGYLLDDGSIALRPDGTYATV